MAPTLTPRQRKQLRGVAHSLDPVGQGGVTDTVLRSLDAALLAHELVKVRLHEPEDEHGDAACLAEGAGAALCGLVGHTLILYRKPRITLA